jgi:hypothetical protein
MAGCEFGHRSAAAALTQCQTRSKANQTMMGICVPGDDL